MTGEGELEVGAQSLLDLQEASIELIKLVLYLMILMMT